MKNLKKISTMCLMVILMTMFSCSNEDPIGSFVTNYAVIDFEPVVAVPVGGTFTPSATATEGGNDIPVVSSGTVDTSTVGVYSITYSATNVDGYDAVAVQTIVVHDPNIIGTNVSGEIWDKNNHSRKGTISLVPGTSSIFYVTDFGFAGLFPIYFQMNGDTISDIAQVYPLDQTGVDLAYDSGSKEFTVAIDPAGFSYTFEYQ